MPVGFTQFNQFLNDKVIEELNGSDIHIAETLSIGIRKNPYDLGTGDDPEAESNYEWWRFIDFPKETVAKTYIGREVYVPPEEPPVSNEPDPPETIPYEPPPPPPPPEPITVIDGILYHFEDRLYYPYPFRREGIKREISNISKQTRVLLPDTQEGIIRAMLREGVEFRGSKVILTQLFINQKDQDNNSIVLLDGFLQDWNYDASNFVVTFSVTRTILDQGATWPRRHMIFTCTHIFKGTRCEYVGEGRICTKAKTGGENTCEWWGRVPRHGAFPWVAARQRKILWK